MLPPKMYQLFGDLVLDPPPPDRLEAVKELEPYLRDLESREKLVVNRDEIHRKVSSFRLDETQKWKEMAQEGCPKRVAEHIVTTTGSWEARLSHQMHVPSYTSLNIPNGETGDPTSPCPALIMANKFDPETHFIYDHFHRREESDFSPFKGYPDHIRELHEEHTAWIRATNQAKVEIIYGRYVEKWVTKNLELSHLQLWGEYDRVWLHFEWRSPERKQLSKILLFALHPQRFLNLPSGLAGETATQDKLHSCACKLAGLPYIANYYSSREWKSMTTFIHNASVKRLGKSERETTELVASFLRNCHAPESPRTETTGTQEAPVMSLRRLNILLSKVLTRSASENVKFREPGWQVLKIDENRFPACLPPLIHEWIIGQQAYFFRKLIQTPIDLLSIYTQYCGSKDNASIPGTMNVILALMDFQQVRIKAGGTKHYETLSQCFSSFETISRVCDTCRDSLDPDHLPKYSFYAPDRYLVRKVQCKSKTCQGLLRNAVPTAEISYLHGVRRLKESYEWEKTLRPAGDCGDQASSVELWCIRCQEKTSIAVSDSDPVKEAPANVRNTVLDSNPRWTLGSRPKYVPRSFHCCMNCNPGDQNFVPVSTQIPFIFMRTLKELVERFHYMEVQALAAILDSQKSASHCPRVLKRKRRDDRDSQLLTSNTSRELKTQDPEKPKVIDLRCIKCKMPAGQDVDPMWHTDTGDYIARRRDHKSCGERRVWLIPMDGTLWVRDSTVAQKQQRENDKLLIGGHTAKLGLEDPTQPSIVNLKCYECGDLLDDDDKPKWHAITGKYIAQRKIHCKGETRIYRVPADNTLWIRSVTVYGQEKAARRKAFSQSSTSYVN